MGSVSSQENATARHVSVREVVAVAYRFPLRSPGSILRLAWFPLLLAGLILFVSLDSYFADLAEFFRAPDTRIASVALGLMTAGIFVAAFLVVMVVVALTELAFGQEPNRAWIYFRVQRVEWRLYAAILRFALVLTAFLASASAISWAIAEATGTGAGDAYRGGWLDWGTWIVVAAGTLFLTARIAFLMPAIAVAEKGPVARRAWSLGRRDFPRLVLIVVLLALPGMVFQAVAEIVLRVGGVLPPVGAGTPVAQYPTLIRDFLPGFLAITVPSWLVHLPLFSAGAVAAYRQLAASNGQKGA